MLARTRTLAGHATAEFGFDWVFSSHLETDTEAEHRNNKNMKLKLKTKKKKKAKNKSSVRLLVLDENVPSPNFFLFVILKKRRNSLFILHYLVVMKSDPISLHCINILLVKSRGSKSSCVFACL